MATSRIGELAAIIATHTKQIDAHLADTGLPGLSFDPDSPARVLLDNRVIASRQAILDATDELHALMQGPIDILIRQPVSTEAIILKAQKRPTNSAIDSLTFSSALKLSPNLGLRPLSRPAATEQRLEILLRPAESPKLTSDGFYDMQWHFGSSMNLVKASYATRQLPRLLLTLLCYDNTLAWFLRNYGLQRQKSAK